MNPLKAGDIADWIEACIDGIPADDDSVEPWMGNRPKVTQSGGNILIVRDLTGAEFQVRVTKYRKHKKTP